MRKLAFIICLLICQNGACQYLSQQHSIVPFHTFGNLYIVTIDKSFSMTHGIPNYDPALMAGKFGIAPLIQSLKKGGDIFNFQSDRFIFFTSGLEQRPDEQLIPLDTSLLPFYDIILHKCRSLENQESFISSNQLERRIKDILATQNYGNSSFVSLLKYEALSSVINGFRQNNKDFCLRYKNIFVINITDDEDQNDKWAADLRIFQRYLPIRLNEINQTIDRLHFNPLNSDSKHNGYYQELPYNRNEKVKTIPFKYFTYDALPDTQEIQNSFKIELSKDSSLIIRFNKELKNSVYRIECFWLDSLLCGGKPLQSGLFVVSDSLRLKVAHFNSYFGNDICLKGYAQVVVPDSIFGRRIRPIYFVSSQRVYPPSFYIINLWVFISVISVILIAFAYRFVFYPRKTFVYIEDNLGNNFRVVNSFFLNNKSPLVELAQIKVGTDLSDNFVINYPSKYIKRGPSGKAFGSEFFLFVASNIQLNFTRTGNFELTDSDESVFNEEFFYAYPYPGVEERLKALIKKHKHVYLFVAKDLHRDSVSFLRSLRSKDEYRITFSGVSSPCEDGEAGSEITQIQCMFKKIYKLEYPGINDLIFIFWNDQINWRWAVLKLNSFVDQDKIEIVYYYSVKQTDTGYNAELGKKIIELILNNKDFDKIKKYSFADFSFLSPETKFRVNNVFKSVANGVSSEIIEQCNFWDITRYPFTNYIFCVENKVTMPAAKLIYSPLLDGVKQNVIYKEPPPRREGYDIISGAFSDYRGMESEENRFMTRRNQERPQHKEKYSRILFYIKNLFWTRYSIEKSKN